MINQDDTVSELRREVAGLCLGLFLAASVVLAALALWNLFAVWNIPKFEKIFEDMLGSREKLPELTQLVIAYSRATGNLLPFVAVGSFTLIAWSVMLLKRHTWKFLLVGVCAIIVLTLHGLVITVALNFPLLGIIQGINGR